MSLDRIKELVLRMKELQDDIDARRAVQTGYQKELDALRNHEIPDMMDSEETSKLTFKGVGTVHLYPMLSVKTREGMMPALKHMLIEEGHGDIITETVNSSTLKALVSEQMKKGWIPPEDILEISSWSQARILKR